MAIEISGHSDDVVSIREYTPEGRSRADQVWEDELSPNLSILLGTERAGVIVVMRFAPGKSSTWQASVRQIGEGIPIPWPVTITEHENTGAVYQGSGPRLSYSVLVSIDCPCETPVKCGRTKLPRP